MTAALHQAVVLVVDDDEAVCQSLGDALRTAGLQPLLAGGVEAALDIARQQSVDLVVADLFLGDGSGLEVIDRLRRRLGLLPAVIITGQGDAANLAQARQFRTVELVRKPINLEQLLGVIQYELSQGQPALRLQHRHRRLRDLARRSGQRRRRQVDRLYRACARMAVTCRQYRSKLILQERLMRYQNQLIGCVSPDDIFRSFFRLFVEHSGSLFGAALLCDEQAELEMVGRFGVPSPDGVAFCRELVTCLLPGILERPKVTRLDAYEHLELFPPQMHRRLVGVSFMVVPLMAGEGKLIGLVVLYRRGEQPFTDADVALATMVALPTTSAAQRT